MRSKENEALKASIESNGDVQRQSDLLAQISQTLKAQLLSAGVKKPEEIISKLTLAAEVIW